jgi:hypothetical protein
MPSDAPVLPFPADVAARAALAKRPRASVASVLRQARESQLWRENHGRRASPNPGKPDSHIQSSP